MSNIDNSKTQIKETQDQITPQAAIDLLKAGNQRFLDGASYNRDNSSAIDTTSGGQWPFAVVLGCIDSRVPSETIFDQGIGDIFNCRVAGNFINKDILGSMEYSCAVAGSKAILVMGHTHCGAVKSACDHVELGNITHLLSNIMPAVDEAEGEGERNSSNATFVQNVSDLNVKKAIENIRSQSDILREMEEKGEITIVGAMYDVETGKVRFDG